MPEQPYTQAELLHVGDYQPIRGPVCPKCKQHIPQFAELKDAERYRVLELIGTGRSIQAAQELRAFASCPLEWAKIWVVHSGRPDALGTSAPCPYCGKPLMTALARQCRYCFMDWHDPDHPKSLV